MDAKVGGSWVGADTVPGGGARVITLAEAAERLRVSKSTVLRLVRDGELKAFRVRKAWRTSTAACDEFVRRRFAEQELACRSIEEA